MKTITFVILGCLLLELGCRRTNNSSPTFTEGYDIFIAGTNNGNGGYWKNGQFKNLGRNSRVSGFVFNGEDVFIYGAMGGSDTYHPIPGYWKNDQWTPLKILLSGAATGLAIDGNDIYVSGYEVPATDLASYTQTHPVLWKNGEITYLPDSGTFGQAGKMVFANGSTYIEGSLAHGCCYPGEAVVWKDSKLKIYQDTNVPNFVGIAQIGEDIYLAGQNGGLSSFFYKNDVEEQFIPPFTVATSIKAIDSDIYLLAYRRDTARLSVDSYGYYKNEIYIDATQANLSDSSQPLNLVLSDLDKAGNDLYIVGSEDIPRSNSSMPIILKNGVVIKLADKGEARVIGIRPKN